VARDGKTLNAAVASLNDEKYSGKATAAACDIGELSEIKKLFLEDLPALEVSLRQCPRAPFVTDTLHCTSRLPHRQLSRASPPRLYSIYITLLIALEVSHIDIFIANAGIMPCIFMDPATTDDALEVATMRVNAEGTHFLTKYALPFILRAVEDINKDPFQRSMLYMASAAAWLTEPEEGNGMLMYHASKAAVNGTMVSLYQTFDAPCEPGSMTAIVRAGRSVGGRIASVNPGFVATGLGGETLPPGMEDREAYQKAKLESMGAISIEQGADTMLWLALAKDGAAESGKHYFERKPHTF